MTVECSLLVAWVSRGLSGNGWAESSFVGEAVRMYVVMLPAKDGLYQVLVNNTILYTILDKNMQNYTILYTNTIPSQIN